MQYMIATTKSTAQNQDKLRSSNLQVWTQSRGEVCSDTERSDLAEEPQMAQAIKVFWSGWCKIVSTDIWTAQL